VLPAVRQFARLEDGNAFCDGAVSLEHAMPSEARSPRLAVLIDADNASAKIADGLLDEIAKIGEASVRRVYGDFSSARSKGWADTLSNHAIIPQQQFAYTTDKNASDITFVIDAMELLHSGRFDGFCLVSSDSDFTRLAARIREQGVDVFGFGEQKTPESFRCESAWGFRTDRHDKLLKSQYWAGSRGDADSQFMPGIEIRRSGSLDQGQRFQAAACHCQGPHQQSSYKNNGETVQHDGSGCNDLQRPFRRRTV